ncbi:prepilin-type N-terminal cleavage/methylation domain-containing protein [Candidatus Kaiserbacteria bacterium]|nr:prepilin-type N-terminal cleavage/methylation domain-containing protein [Candidatus Kaiserbacteria bacterium]
MVLIDQRNRSTTSSRAFTLIELLVVTAIITVVSSVVLVSNNRFGGVVQLQNLAYDIALSIRQAQVYGISVQRFGTNCSEPGSACFESGYGMHFLKNDAQHYELFADVDQDGLYVVSENVPPSPYTISGGFRIIDLCAPEGTSWALCKDASPATQLDIVFKRPEPGAWISANGVACTYGAGICADSARIVLISPRGDVMSVLVEANGQISVKKESSQ